MNSLVLQQGAASTSFLTLYEGFQYFSFQFEQEECVLAYMETASAWIGASEPIASSQALPHLLRAFDQAAKKSHKKALLLPVSRETALVARSLGYFAVEIGQEPWFNVRHLKPSLPPAARQLKTRGASVEVFLPNEISPRERAELDQLTEEWLESRKMATLGFLNRLEPWTQLSHKLYFRVVFHGQQIGYLAAVPIPKKNAWYFVDLIRLPSAPAGTTELLISEAMSFLQSRGYQWMTLGMAPFVPVSNEEHQVHPIRYSLFKLIFSHFNQFYRFKSLKDFKDKFKPDFYEPQFLISLDSTLSLKAYTGLFQAIFPKGVFHTLSSTVLKTSTRFNPAALYSFFLGHHFVPRNPPKNWSRYFLRAKVTLELAIITVLIFIMSVDLNLQLRPKMIERYAYSFERIHSWFNVVIASFLHWDHTHLAVNLISLLCFVGFLECLAGSRLVLLTYFTGALLSNPLTSILLYPVFRLAAPLSLSQFVSEYDVGSSLGIFACAGALFYFSRFTTLLIALFCAGTFVYALISGSWLGLNHITALFIGLGIGRIYVGKK